MSAPERPASPTYSKELGEAICERISKGEPLAQICRDEGMPSDSTVRRWANPKSPFHIEAFAADLAAAREMGEEAIAEDCLHIADDRSHDWVEREGKDGRVERVFDAEHVQRSKLRIDTRLRLLAKFNPRRWGDRIQQTHQIGHSLEEIVMASYRKRPNATPSPGAPANLFSPVDGLLIPVAAVAGGLLGGSAAAIAKTATPARHSEDEDSAA